MNSPPASSSNSDDTTSPTVRTPYDLESSTECDSDSENNSCASNVKESNLITATVRTSGDDDSKISNTTLKLIKEDP